YGPQLCGEGPPQVMQMPLIDAAQFPRSIDRPCPMRWQCLYFNAHCYFIRRRHLMRIAMEYLKIAGLPLEACASRWGLGPSAGGGGGAPRGGVGRLPALTSA